MRKPKCFTILGARPQFIKAAPLSKAMSSAGWSEALIHTGQHYDHEMSAVFFEELGIPIPRFHLGVAGGSHGEMVGRMLIALSSLLKEHRPDLVLVYGDTNSTLAGALAAAQLNIPVAHVEAGLRSHRFEMPEEKNRRVTDHLSRLLLCPTQAAIKQLEIEGITRGVSWVGDLMFDMARDIEEEPSLLPSLDLDQGRYAVMTLHRAECCDHPDRLQERLAWLSKQSQRAPIIWPIHPRAKVALERLGECDLGQIHLIRPLGYRAMATLLKNAAEVYTDSGGVQREAFFHRIPCTTLREESEWPETIDAGWNRLWRDRESPLPSFEKRGRAEDYFGEERAAPRIMVELNRFAHSELQLG